MLGRQDSVLERLRQQAQGSIVFFTWYLGCCAISSSYRMLLHAARTSWSISAVETGVLCLVVLRERKQWYHSRSSVCALEAEVGCHEPLQQVYSKVAREDLVESQCTVARTSLNKIEEGSRHEDMLTA